MALTPEHIEAMEDSWAEVCKNMKSNGVNLYETWFSVQPEYQDYFADFRGVPLNEFQTNKKVRIHGTRVMHALSSMVTSLDELDVVAGIMVKIVVKHYDYKVQSITPYEGLFSILPTFLERHAGEKFTKLAQEGWGIALGVLLSVAKGRLEEMSQQEVA